MDAARENQRHPQRGVLFDFCVSTFERTGTWRLISASCLAKYTNHASESARAPTGGEARDRRVTQ
eukprot:3592510-Rhodomonas_salina.2